MRHKNASCDTKMLLATRWSLDEVKGSQNLFIYSYATQLLSKTPFSKLLMFMRLSKKLQKMLHVTRWSLVEAKGVTKLFCMLDGAKLYAIL